MNTSGVPLPMVMDPLTGKGSVTCSLVCLSALFVILAICNVPHIDKMMSEDFFLYCMGGYLGRTLLQKGKTAILGTTEVVESLTSEDAESKDLEPDQRKHKDLPPSSPT